MAKAEKPAKSGFVIKLSSETVQKLTEEEQKLKVVDKDAIDTSGNLTEPTELLDNGKSGDSEEVTSENVINPNNNKPDETTASAKSKDDLYGDYAPYITYEGEEAIYTDPTTHQRYNWDEGSNSWALKSGENVPGRTYSYEDDTHVYTEADGSKSFWDEDKKAWIPKVDEDFLARYQMSYGFVDNTASEDTKTKKKEEKEHDTVTAGVKRKNEPQWFEQSDDKNTKVYVSNLPLDVTEEEFVNLMQKCGLVERDPSSQKMKIKMYADKEQNCFKGDALCTYIKIESVDLALKLLDGSDYKGNKIKVERAQFQMKGDYNPSLKPKKKKKKELDKLKKIQQKLFDWRPEKFIGERSKHEKVVIVKNLFHPSDFDNEVQLILDYQQDLREECSKCGEVKKVVIYDRHPEGVAQISMKEPEQADAVIQLINGRWFGKRQITAETWDGRTKFRIAETEADLNQRINKWDKFLEQGEKKDKKQGDATVTKSKDKVNDQTGDAAVPKSEDKVDDQTGDAVVPKSEGKVDDQTDDAKVIEDKKLESEICK